MRFRLRLSDRARHFLTEIAIVVVGVLIALAAQQTVDSLNWRGQLREFREAVDVELAHDFAVLDYRRTQQPCVMRRIDELEQWLAAWRAGKPVALTGPIGRIPGLSLHTGVWAVRSDALMLRMPLEARIAYSRTYDQIGNVEQMGSDERSVWRELADFDGATQLDAQALMRLRGLITRARSFAELTQLNADGSRLVAKRMGIVPKLDVAVPPAQTRLCDPIMPVAR
jgi:hypothetical protein